MPFEAMAIERLECGGAATIDADCDEFTFEMFVLVNEVEGRHSLQRVLREHVTISSCDLPQSGQAICF
jgi:hypothetical protein